jgi:N-acetylglucosaminyl-diphospho-decaprenol L-rhamnosyltransferase
MSQMDISVIVVSYNTAGLLEQCIGDLRSAMDASLTVEIVFVDNASSDNSVEVIKTKFPECRLIENERNVGFGRANNQALPFATGRYFLLLNTDAFVAADSLSKTVAFMDANPRCGILGTRLEGRDGVLQPSCRYFPTSWNTFLQRTGLNRVFKGVQMVDDMEWAHDTVRTCDWVVGCYYLVRKELIDQIGLFDPRYFLYFEEVDHCFAAKKAGWDVVFYPHTTVVHLGGESAKSEGAITKGGKQLEALQIESELLYFRKNHGLDAAVASVALTWVAELFNLLKRVLKPGVPLNAGTTLRRIALVWGIFVRTRWAAQATR